MAKNKKIVCPHCGATLENSGYANVICPYCGGKLEIAKSYKVDEIVLFSVDEEEAKQMLTWKLAQDDTVPLELFDTLSFDSTKIYVPLWHLGGSYNASWSCDRLEYKEEVYYDKNGERRTRMAAFPDRYPVNGNAKGAFDILLSASHGFPYSSRYDSYSSEAFNEELIDKDALIYRMDVENGKAWESDEVGCCIDSSANSHVKQQLPVQYDRLHSEVSYNRAINRSVLFPFWELKFEYEGKSYNCILRGDDGEVTSYHHPKAKKNLNDNSDLKSPIKIGRFGWLCFLTFIVAGLLAFIIGANNLSSVVVVIEFVLLSAFSLFALVNLNSKQYDEEKSFEKVRENRKKKRHEERLNALVDVPLLQPYKTQLSKVSDIKTSPKEHNKRIVRDSRIKKLYFHIIIFFILLIIISYIVSGIDIRYEKQQQAEEQALLFDNAKKTMNQITPDLFFHKSDSQIGHLRQDIVSQLTRLGFVKDEEHPNQVVLSTSEVYSLYMNDGESPIIQIVLNDKPYGLIENKNEIRDICIKIYDLTLADEFMSAFKDNIERNSFVAASDINIKPTTPLGTSLPISINSDSYIRIGKTVRKQDFLSEELYFNYDVVEFKKGYSEAEIVCYSHADKNINATEVEEAVEAVITDSVVTDGEYSNRDDAAVDRMVETAHAE